MRLSITVSLFVASTLAFGCASSKGAKRDDPGPPQSVDEVVRRAVQPTLDARPRPGAVVVGVTVEGVHHVFSFGAVDGMPPTGASLFPLGTGTQPFTAMLLATHVADGELDYDESVGTRSCSTRQITAYCYRGDATTYRHLVQHTSGLPTEAEVKTELDDLNDFLAGYDLGIAPGKRYRPSEIGYATLGAILSRRFEVEPDDAIRGRILQPLGMEDTTFTPRVGEAVPGYDNGVAVPPHNSGVFKYSDGMYSTAEDLLGFLDVHLDPQAHAALADAIRLTHRVSDAIEVDASSRAANGWYYRPASDVYWHDGVGPGHRAFFGFDVDSATGVVVLSNEAATGTRFDELGFDILQGIERLRTGATGDQGPSDET